MPLAVTESLTVWPTEIEVFARDGALNKNRPMKVAQKWAMIRFFWKSMSKNFFELCALTRRASHRSKKTFPYSYFTNRDCPCEKNFIDDAIRMRKIFATVSWIGTHSTAHSQFHFVRVGSMTRRRIESSRDLPEIFPVLHESAA